MVQGFSFSVSNVLEGCDLKTLVKHNLKRSNIYDKVPYKINLSISHIL